MAKDRASHKALNYRELEQVGRWPAALPPGAMLEGIEPTFERRFGLMGQPLLFQTNDRRILALAEDALGDYPLPDDPAAPPLILRLYRHEVNGLADDPSPSLLRTQGHLCYHTIGAGNTIVLDLVAGYGYGFLTPALIAQTVRMRHQVIRSSGLLLLTPARHYIPLHASCVVIDGMALILVGDAGRGKSTTAYACARREHQVVTEDGLTMQVRPEGLTLWGMPWQIHLLPDSVRFFPELAAERPQLQMNGEWKLAIEIERYHPGSAQASAPPGLVLFLERGDPHGAPGLVPVDLAQARQEISVVWPWRVGWTPEMDQGLDQLLDGRAYRLQMNGSPDAIVDSLELAVQQNRGDR